MSSQHVRSGALRNGHEPTNSSNGTGVRLAHKPTASHNGPMSLTLEPCFQGERTSTPTPHELPRGRRQEGPPRRSWPSLLQRFFESVDDLAAFIREGGLAEIALLLPRLCERLNQPADGQVTSLALQVRAEGRRGALMGRGAYEAWRVVRCQWKHGHMWGTY